MSISAGPTSVTNGLVFEYDMNNTQKSWKGKPITNLVTNPTKEVIGSVNEFVQWGDIAPIFNTNGLVPYSLSLDLKATQPGNVLVYMQNGSSTKYSFVYQTVSVTTEYQRFTFNNLTPAISNASDTAATLAFYGTYGTGRIPSIKNVQIELGSYATPFVNGTRSNTQALLDLTNNNTITATSLTYASDNTFSFNGSSNYISVADNSILTNTSALSIDIWFKGTDVQTRYNDLIGKGTSDADEEYCILVGNGTIYFDVGNGSGPFTQLSYTFSNNTWYNISGVHTRSGGSSSLVIYLNGSLLSSGVAAPTNTPNDNSIPISIGRRFGSSDPYSRTFNGIMPIVRLYNRALSAAEIQQNFNATRSRYGL